MRRGAGGRGGVTRLAVPAGVRIAGAAAPAGEVVAGRAERSQAGAPGGIGEIPGGEVALGPRRAGRRAERFDEFGHFVTPSAGGRGGGRDLGGRRDQDDQPGAGPPVVRAEAATGAQGARDPRGTARGAAFTLGVGIPHWSSHPLAGPCARPAMSLVRSLAGRTVRP